MPVAPLEAPLAGQRLSERPPVTLGYSSPLPAARPVRRLWGAVTALLAGVLLLGIALYALLSIATILSSPQAQGFAQPSRVLQDLVPPLLGVFAGICTVTALVFLGVGLKWLGGVSRAVE